MLRLPKDFERLWGKMGKRQEDGRKIGDLYLASFLSLRRKGATEREEKRIGTRCGRKPSREID